MSRASYIGAAIFDGVAIHYEAALVVADGRVEAIVPEAGIAAEAVTRLDGGLLAPGFIDLQVNGGDGVMLGEAADVPGIARICRAHARLGTTGLLPTLITDTAEVTRSVIAAGIAAAAAGVPGFLGLHLEGPHLDPRRKGAHDPSLIRAMTEEDLATLVEGAAGLPALILTVAPEAVRPDQIAALTAAGAIVSLGHSDCSLDLARTAIDAGARMATHLFNAMSPLGNREPGLVGAVLDDGRLHAGLIADGVHVAPAAIRIALAAKRGPGRVVLVTDAMAVAGTNLTEFTLGGRRIRRDNGRLTLENGTLAGADCDFPACLRVLVGPVGIPLAEALRMATSGPADVLGRPDLGRLSPGAAADMVHLGDSLDLRGVWRAGEPLDA